MDVNGKQEEQNRTVQGDIEELTATS